MRILLLAPHPFFQQRGTPIAEKMLLQVLVAAGHEVEVLTFPEGEDPEEAFKRIQGMIDSMTKEERRNPDVIDINRRRRIASGSGTEPHEVKQFLAQFEQIRVLMRQMMQMSMWERIKMVTGLGQRGAFDPGSTMLKSMTKGDTGHRKTAKERAEERKKKKKKK